MKTTAALAVAVLFLVAVSSAQDHAPTVEQCRADQSLWWEQFNTRELISKLSARKLSQRSGEMHDCAAVDEEHRNSYERLGAMFQMEFEQRLLDFVTRHDLMEKFLSEDAAGKR